MKKNGRLVAIALGSVLCASCVGGAFLVAGSTPAAETVKAADVETVTYTFTLSNTFADAEETAKQFLENSVELNSKIWSFSDPVSKESVQGTKTRRYIQLGGSSYAFPESTLSIDTSDLFGSGYGVTSVSVDCAFTEQSYIEFSVDDTQFFRTEDTPSWTSSHGDVVTGTSDTPLSGLLQITFGPQTSKAIYLHSITVTGEKVATEPVSYDHIGFVGNLRKTEYFVGDAFTLDGVSIYAYPTAENVDGVDVTDEAEFITDPEVFSEPGEEVGVYVYVTFGELEADQTFYVKVNPEITAETLTVSGLEEEKVYSVGDVVDFSLVKITAHMSDGSDYDATYDLALEPYTVTLEDAANGSVEFPLEFKGATSSIVISTGLGDILSARKAGDGSKVAIKGLVTGKFVQNDNYSIFVEDDTAAVMLYDIDAKLADPIRFGDEIAAEGELYLYNGLFELKNVSEIAKISSGNDVQPTALEEFDSALLEDWDAKYVSLSGLRYSSGYLFDESKNNKSTLYLNFNGEDIMFFSLDFNGAKEMQPLFDDFLDKIEKLPFTFTGHIGNTYRNQRELTPTSISEFSCPDYDAVMAFINDYMQPNISHDDTDEGNACLEWYPKAKQALEAMTDAQQDYFLTSKETADYAARYKAWAKAYGEGATSSLGTIMSSNDTAAIIALVALSSATVAAAGFMIASRRRKAK